MGKAYENVSVYAEFLEDPGAPADHLKPESVEKGAGELEVGALIDGTKFVFFRVPAGRFLKDQRLAEQARKDEEQAKADQAEQESQQHAEQGYQQPQNY